MHRESASHGVCMNTGIWHQNFRRTHFLLGAKSGFQPFPSRSRAGRGLKRKGSIGYRVTQRFFFGISSLKKGMFLMQCVAHAVLRCLRSNLACSMQMRWEVYSRMCS